MVKRSAVEGSGTTASDPSDRSLDVSQESPSLSAGSEIARKSPSMVAASKARRPPIRPTREPSKTPHQAATMTERILDKVAGLLDDALDSALDMLPDERWDAIRFTEEPFGTSSPPRTAPSSGPPETTSPSMVWIHKPMNPFTARRITPASFVP